MIGAIIFMVAALQLNAAFGEPTGGLPTGIPRTVARTTDELSRTTDEMSRTTDEMSRTTDEMSRTTDEMSRTTDAISRTTDERSRTTEEGRRTTEEGPRATGGPFTVIPTGSKKPEEPEELVCKIDYEMNYGGCDIGSSVRPSWTECAQACQRRSGCNFWTYNPAIKRCYYKSRKCIVRHHARLTSGNKACGQPCKVDYSTDYWGCDIGFSIEGSWQECAKKCSKTRNCHFWTWAHRLSPSVPLKCHLKSRQCNINVGKPNVISGNRACAMVDDHRCTPYYGKDWTCGKIIKKECNIFNWQRCADLCNRTPACHFWTWMHGRSTYLPNNCLLRAGGDCKLRNQGNTLAGERFCRGQDKGRY